MPGLAETDTYAKICAEGPAKEFMLNFSKSEAQARIL
jgi:hypothetical protein